MNNKDIVYSIDILMHIKGGQCLEQWELFNVYLVNKEKWVNT